MNKLNSPIVILCLIIATLFNSILSVDTFIQNKNDNNTTDTYDTKFIIYCTKNSDNNDWQNTLTYNNDDTEEQNLSILCANVQIYGYQAYKVSFNNNTKECSIYGKSKATGMIGEQLYTGELFEYLIDKFKIQNTMTIDTVTEAQGVNEHIKRTFKPLPLYMIMKIDKNGNTSWYTIDNELLDNLKSCL